jgi:hypothetical protein
MIPPCFHIWQYALSALVERMAIEHPYHTMYQVFGSYPSLCSPSSSVVCSVAELCGQHFPCLGDMRRMIHWAAFSIEVIYLVLSMRETHWDMAALWTTWTDICFSQWWSCEGEPTWENSICRRYGQETHSWAAIEEIDSSSQRSPDTGFRWRNVYLFIVSTQFRGACRVRLYEVI